MSESVTLARPYAEALFEMAQSSSNTTCWRDFLKNFAVISQDSVVRNLLSNPSISRETRTRCFTALVESTPDLLVRFLQLLATKDRLVILPEIAALFERLCDQQDGVLHAKLTVSQPVSDSYVSQLQAHLSTQYQAQVQVTVDIDPTLVGGGTVKIGDEIIDVSLRTLLTRLQQTLTT